MILLLYQLSYAAAKSLRLSIGDCAGLGAESRASTGRREPDARPDEVSDRSPAQIGHEPTRTAGPFASWPPRGRVLHSATGM